MRLLDPRRITENGWRTVSRQFFVFPAVSPKIIIIVTMASERTQIKLFIRFLPSHEYNRSITDKGNEDSIERWQSIIRILWCAGSSLVSQLEDFAKSVSDYPWFVSEWPASEDPCSSCHYLSFYDVLLTIYVLFIGMRYFRRWKMRDLRLLCESPHLGSHLRRMQLRQQRKSLRRLRECWCHRRILLQRVRSTGETLWRVPQNCESRSGTWLRW